MKRRQRNRRSRGVLAWLEAPLFCIVTGAIIYFCMTEMQQSEAFTLHASKKYSESSQSILFLRQHDDFTGSVEDFEEIDNRLDVEIEGITMTSTQSSEYTRRNFFLVAAATVSFFPMQYAFAYQNENGAEKSLEDLQFARGTWNPGSQKLALKEKPVETDDLNFASNTLKDDINASTGNKALTRIDACFTTYLTRFLINYDEGVAAWWKRSQLAYSQLTVEQRQNRLGRDFGSLASSIQDALQVYIQKATSTREGYHQLFDRFVSTYAVSTNSDEIRRQLCLLAAILPVDQQPRDVIQRIIPTTTTTISRRERDNLSFAEVMNENLSNLLPLEYNAAFIKSDQALLIQPPIKLYQVGVGEEFGQAATATTFGPLALNSLRRELPRYTFDIYALFGISGATGCALTHSVVIPLDVIKTRAQTSSESTMNIAKEIVNKEGISGLLTGAQATLAGYAWYGVSVYPSYAFFKRFLGQTVLTSDVAVAHESNIALFAGALAAVVASLGLTPLEAARIRVVAEPSRYRAMGLSGTLEVIASEGGTGLKSSMESLYRGLPSLMTRQVIFGSVKFLAFERACEAIYLAWPMLRDETWTALTVSLVAGAFSGALSCLVSQPADAVLTYVAQESANNTNGKKKRLGVVEGSRLMIEESGVSSLFRGLGSRSLWAASIISGQFLLYDIFRNYFGVNSQDLSQIFKIDL
mmetsp:Transcript_2834/g.7780  ORF Transcript_2834/g.7780 Transcript_2834/m.7780 type:complete len:697 (-) Transcript_2834:84-2174(-)